MRIRRIFNARIHTMETEAYSGFTRGVQVLLSSLKQRSRAGTCALLPARARFGPARSGGRNRARPENGHEKADPRSAWCAKAPKRLAAAGLLT